MLLLNRTDEALVRYRAEPSPTFALAGQAIALHAKGDTPGAEAAFRKLVATLGDSASYQQAQVYARWGRTGAALERLERARAVGDGGILYLRNDPMMDSLRAEPRFVALLRGIGFAS